MMNKKHSMRDVVKYSVLNTSGTIQFHAEHGGTHGCWATDDSKALV
jgi:hypothetical protein